jgi:hypothetical protein
MSKENVDLARRLYSTVSIVITSDAAGDPLHATTEQINRLVREDLDENFEFRLPADYRRASRCSGVERGLISSSPCSARAGANGVWSPSAPSENRWNNNNRCNTEDGTVPPSVCDQGE